VRNLASETWELVRKTEERKCKTCLWSYAWAGTAGELAQPMGWHCWWVGVAIRLVMQLAQNISLNIITPIWLLDIDFQRCPNVYLLIPFRHLKTNNSWYFKQTIYSLWMSAGTIRYCTLLSLACCTHNNLNHLIVLSSLKISVQIVKDNKIIVLATYHRQFVDKSYLQTCCFDSKLCKSIESNM